MKSMEIYTWHHKEVYILPVESKRSLSKTNAMYKKFRQIKDIKIYHKSDASISKKKFVKMLLHFFQPSRQCSFLMEVEKNSWNHVKHSEKLLHGKLDCFAICFDCVCFDFCFDFIIKGRAHFQSWEWAFKIVRRF